MRGHAGTERDQGWHALIVGVATACVLAGLFFASAAGARGLEGVLRFRLESPEVQEFGLVVASLFVVAVGLTCGALTDGGEQRYLVLAANLAVKATLLVAVAFMFAFPHLPQFENKSLTLRAVFYPLLSVGLFAAYRLRGMRGPYPGVLDLCLTFALMFDIVSNDLHWYGRWRHWDDFVHFVNSVPFMVMIAAALLTVERFGAIRLGLWGVALVAFAVYGSAHALWEMYEFSMDRFTGTELQPGGMEEATRNNVAGLVGSLVSIALLWWWHRLGALQVSVVEPLASYLSRAR